MYDRSKWYTNLLARLHSQDKEHSLKGQYALLLRVELGLRLLELLQLTDEPITVLWVILSNNPLPHARLRALDARDRRAIANARILLPFSGHFNWESALQTYAAIDEQWRNYRVSPDNLEKQKVFNLHSHEERLEVYDQTLTGLLSFARRNIEPAPAGQCFFDALTDSGKQKITVEIDQESADLAALDLSWFSTSRPRQPLSYSYDDFLQLARDLDDLERRRKPGLQPIWENLVLNMLGYRAVLADGSLAQRNEVPLHIDGHAYVVGAVGSGKSVIARFILADAALHPEKERRITLVVSDTMAALHLADELNGLFCKPGDPPLALPLVGRSTRNTHLQRLYRSDKFHDQHWGLRWLNPACPLQALVTSSHFSCVSPGQEPCEALYRYTDDPEPKKIHYSCPLFAACPSKQQYRDMPSACIWIITPGSLGKSGVPAQMEERKVSLTEIVYEQSDLVIFDEADTVQEWFDNLFAEEVVLTNGSNGLLDKEDVETARSLVQQRTLRPHTRRWVEAERHSLISISNILSNLTDRQHGALLNRWIERNYFTALTLAYKLLWRLLDFPKWEECQGQERKAAMERIKPLMAYFVKLNEKDPLKMKRPSTGAPEQSYRLALIMRSLLAAGDSTHNEVVEEECKSWILAYIPNINQTLQKLEKELEEQKRQSSHKSTNGKVEAPDTLETFALRLEFVLNVMILDRNIRIVFYEWYEKPDMMSTDLNETSLQGSPDNVKDILPVPPTGRVFGTYYSKDLETGQADTLLRTRTSGLSVFGYSNIGRWYMMNFHKLFSELDGQPGPNVLSLSGTSWLPNSSRWHLDMPPQGILEPPQEAREAIKQSVFSFIPQYKLVEQSRLKRRMRGQKSQGNTSNKPEKVLEPIFISGESEKMQPIKDLVRALASGQQKKQSFLREELECLQEKGRLEPDYWADRERLLLLVNSYEQARWAYRALVFSEAYPGEICYLTQGKENRDEVVSSEEAEVYRSDIEDFAKKTSSRILIAPMQAIGRGYNILNKNGKAAFGAIFFLTRPMPYPGDTQALARELNRRTLDWCQRQSLPIWQSSLIYEQALALRDKATEYWRKAELRRGYMWLEHKDTYLDCQFSESERFDLAATTVGYVIQACGRLLRGGVPFHAFFVDAAWAPEIALKKARAESSQTSLLTAIFEVLKLYVQNQIGVALYAPIVEALDAIDGFEPR